MITIGYWLTAFHRDTSLSVNIGMALAIFAAALAAWLVSNL
jgi:hypothetical protein